MSHSCKSLMILIAGPYRSGTGDDPILERGIGRKGSALPELE